MPRPVKHAIYIVHDELPKRLKDKIGELYNCEVEMALCLPEVYGYEEGMKKAPWFVLVDSPEQKKAQILLDIEMSAYAVNLKCSADFLWHKQCMIKAPAFGTIEQDRGPTWL